VLVRGEGRLGDIPDLRRCRERPVIEKPEEDILRDDKELDAAAARHEKLNSPGIQHRVASHHPSGATTRAPNESYGIMLPATDKSNHDPTR